jgi:uncharacterized protein YdaU (DUF1376 family)
MSEFPSLPLFTDAYLADTRHLTAQEHGAYLLLLMMAWRLPDCRLPDDDAKLAKWASLDARTWKRIKPTVMAFWTLAEDQWSQSRLTREREFVSKRADVARRNGATGGRPKTLNSNGSDNPAGSTRVTQTKAPSPNPSPKVETEASQHWTAARPKADELQRLLFDAAGISGFRDERHPRLLDLSPIYGLIDAGYELHREILPVIRDKARNKTFSTWRYFEDAIIEAARANKAIPPKPAALVEDWKSRMHYWHLDGTWATGYGPKPGEPGCRVPPELLKDAA